MYFNVHGSCTYRRLATTLPPPSPRIDTLCIILYCTGTNQTKSYMSYEVRFDG